jgi:hypothetical protein
MKLSSIHKNALTRALRLIAFCTIFLGAGIVARAQCPTVDNVGWARGATVRFFLDANMDAEQKRLARWALQHAPEGHGLRPEHHQLDGALPGLHAVA